jgi:hypothetical protein
MMIILFVFLCLITLLAFHFTISSATTWYVKPDGSGDAPTIQAGVDSAAVGDTVMLADGVYTGLGNRDIRSTKMISIYSEIGNPELFTYLALTPLSIHAAV